MLARKLDGEFEFSEAFTYNLTGFPLDLQVGMNVTAWNSLGNTPDVAQAPDLLAQWNYIDFYEITELSTCLINDPL